MRVGGYQLGRRALLWSGLLLVLLLSSLYFLYSGLRSSPPRPAAPPTTSVPIGVQFSGGQTFQPKQIAGPPSAALSASAAKEFSRYRLIRQRPVGRYWLGPTFHGLKPYLPPVGQFIVYTTPQLFAQATGVYVTTLATGQGLGADLAQLLGKTKTTRVKSGRYGVISSGIIALEPRAQTIVEVSVLGSFVRQTSALELAQALH